MLLGYVIVVSTSLKFDKSEINGFFATILPLFYKYCKVIRI